MTNLAEYIKRLQEVSALLKDSKKVAVTVGIVAGKAVEAAVSRRVFLKGRATDNSAIGTYSKEPFYLSPNAPIMLLLPKKRKRKPIITPEGKTGQKVFKNGKPHKTMYLKEGYAQFRKLVGRQPDEKLKKLGGIETDGVNLNLTGSMAQSFTTGMEGNAIVLGFTDAKEFQKARANEQRFGKNIFAVSKAEANVFSAAFAAEMNTIVQKIMQP